MNISEKQKVWLVTGTSSGLGRSFVKAIVENGDCVVATARNKEAILDLEALNPGQVMAMALDVTERAQIKQAVQTVLKTVGRVDVLVNNAGYGYRAAIEEGIDEEVELLFRTNFYGPVALIKAVLPYMRQQKSGAIINISSVAAVNTFAGSGYYGASKCALEGISSALKKEVEPLGIKVMVVEPGAFRTNFSGRSLKQTSVSIRDYAGTASLRRIENDRSHGTQCGDPDKGAKLIVEAIRAENPPLKFILGADAWEVYRQREQKQNEEMKSWLEKSSQTRFEEYHREVKSDE